ncbi:hypothetical protein SCLCIDRAFT_33009 [Scleroderma citrinum Foug A]|uniref:Uncharacterized protein n=1 Tax=Scleroderma citrinum Foug A TaxID=1036808 RepID=A0A0C2YQH6_9AGAM|nr:hypothetical protein SCLCIDRAFT_33009 [Scleroderma citrinum Foug A]
MPPVQSTPPIHTLRRAGPNSYTVRRDGQGDPISIHLEQIQLYLAHDQALWSGNLGHLQPIGYLEFASHFNADKNSRDGTTRLALKDILGTQDAQACRQKKQENLRRARQDTRPTPLEDRLRSPSPRPAPRRDNNRHRPHHRPDAPKEHSPAPAHASPSVKEIPYLPVSPNVRATHPYVAMLDDLSAIASDLDALAEELNLDGEVPIGPDELEELGADVDAALSEEAPGNVKA